MYFVHLMYKCNPSFIQLDQTDSCYYCYTILRHIRSNAVQHSFFLVLCYLIAIFFRLRIDYKCCIHRKFRINIKNLKLICIQNIHKSYIPIMSISLYFINPNSKYAETSCVMLLMMMKFDFRLYAFYCGYKYFCWNSKE